MSDWKAKRFWKTATAEPVADGFSVFLDGRPIRTPAKSALILPTIGYANLVASEWQAQTEIVNPETMPATRTANAAIDKVAVQKAEVAEMLAAYGDADLLCYRANSPAELVTLQAAAWDPYLEWAALELGAQLSVRQGVMHQPQHPDAIANLTKRVHALSVFELAAFHDMVSLTGSLVLGFASSLNFRPPNSVWDASRVDEIWQEQQWGQDDEATAMANRKKSAFLHAVSVFHLS